MDTNNKNKLAFTRQNYVLMLIGTGLLILGLIIMSSDSAQHGFGFFGLTLGPLIVMAGFIVEFFAIMYKPKSKE